MRRPEATLGGQRLLASQTLRRVLRKLKKVNWQQQGPAAARRQSAASASSKLPGAQLARALPPTPAAMRMPPAYTPGRLASTPRAPAAALFRCSAPRGHSARLLGALAVGAGTVEPRLAPSQVHPRAWAPLATLTSCRSVRLVGRRAGGLAARLCQPPLGAFPAQAPSPWQPTGPA